MSGPFVFCNVLLWCVVDACVCVCVEPNHQAVRAEEEHKDGDSEEVAVVGSVDDASAGGVVSEVPC